MIKEPWKHCSSKKKGAALVDGSLGCPADPFFHVTPRPLGHLMQSLATSGFMLHHSSHTHKINAVQHRTLNSFLARRAGPATREGPPRTCVEQTRSMSCSWSLLLFAGPCNLSPHSAVCFAQKFAATIVLRCCSQETQSQSHTCDWNSFLRMFSRGEQRKKSRFMAHRFL